MDTTTFMHEAATSKCTAAKLLCNDAGSAAWCQTMRTRSSVVLQPGLAQGVVQPPALTEQRDILHAQPSRKGLNVVGLVPLYVWQVLGDSNDRGKHGHEARDEAARQHRRTTTEHTCRGHMAHVDVVRYLCVEQAMQRSMHGKPQNGDSIALAA
eukprot:GHRQ01031579.1.p1 GENE.GHRQ01031579.1~~GHRQ01031579.1.p1  ORF type:complete len:154 (-),score=9.53 GHRQ01031579.1:289-750(-)